ncbi:hypothetical protein NG271_743 [Saccharomyces cerevisiae synthetic construct]|uniref:Putative uncharacterized protein YDR467C n=2 Tax=Saccharomyces cerevisiae TaxID=4932 RepID=YD467_YEAST|nr:RecName: Full=Putative uncharacterized protein YDR467C [Saccharomyces cerevisiae S288C]AAB64936.1 Ydr467cp [Saccharomyces cerevisiae]KZV12709.1 hypothetical protein WN66_01555 [Saccharomyces cerevisiae]WNF20293.1 hypothetical protein NG271_743 [Saccharomyces cerevisiae synthetic construct]CAY78965.1 EC1118_1D0_7800p [Saccharomyces cerevisiae EC1118]
MIYMLVFLDRQQLVHIFLFRSRGTTNIIKACYFFFLLFCKLLNAAEAPLLAISLSKFVWLLLRVCKTSYLLLLITMLEGAEYFSLVVGNSICGSGGEGVGCRYPVVLI